MEASIQHKEHRLELERQQQYYEIESTVTAVIASFVEQNHDGSNTTSRQPFHASCKTIVVLIRNAQKLPPVDKFRTLDLNNPKINQRIVQVPGAIDLLAMAGWQRADPPPGSAENRLAYPEENDQDTSEAVVRRLTATALANALEWKVEEMGPVALTPPSKAPSSALDSSTFLSEAERKRRVEAERRAKLAKKEHRRKEAARWREDKEDYKIRQMQQEKLKQRAHEVKVQQKQRKQQSSPSRLSGIAAGSVSETVINSNDETSQLSQKPNEEDEVNQKAFMAANNVTIKPLGGGGFKMPLAIPMQDATNSKPVGNIPTPTRMVASKDTTVDSADQKLAATKFAQDESWTWDGAINEACVVAGVEGIAKTSVYKEHVKFGSQPANIKRIFNELNELKDSLPRSQPFIAIRHDDTNVSFLRALVVGPKNTPYENGCFCFDIYLPPDYPRVSPSVTLLTTGSSTVRFSPNLYADGKVCLSLLGTWNGPGWIPNKSNIYQVLVSIQAMILGVEHPYFNEPSYGGWEGRVKADGQFVQTGHTLAGDVVKEEVNVPQEAVRYEDALRVATVKHAMLECLSEPMPTYLKPFESIIKAHFYDQRNEISQTLDTAWMVDRLFGRKRSANGSSTIDQLKPLVPRLEKSLARLQPALLGDMGRPTKTARFDYGMISGSAHATGTSIWASHESESGITGSATAMKNPESIDGGKSNSATLDAKRLAMQQAAVANDFIEAGKLQGEVQEEEAVQNRISNLQHRMKEAADAADYVTAGKLQLQVQALSEMDPEPVHVEPSHSLAASAAPFQWQQGIEDDDFSSDGEDEDDVGSESSTGGFGGLGTGIFPPPSHSYSSKHQWGTGRSLAATLPPSPAIIEESAAGVTATKPTRIIAAQDLCRLRIRLPDDRTVLLDFHRGDPLSAVYERLEQEMIVGKKSVAKHALVQSHARAGAFAQPESELGFTLLMTRPKREFSLEVHGAKSLDSLNLAPSAALVVMRCSDRGVAVRGELEQRLAEAQGDAINLDGLTYEGLIELTERVGGASIDINVEDYVTTVDPAEYLASAEPEERRCSICLGEFSSTSKLGKLNKCHHVFHFACIATWLKKKTACPLGCSN